MSNALKNIIYTIIIIAVLAVIFYEFVYALKPNYPEVSYWKEYVVQPGDTLWNIVPKDDNYDIRDIIDLVKEHNNIKDIIYAYEKIELPVW